MIITSLIEREILSHIEVIGNLVEESQNSILVACEIAINTLRGGGKIMLCGNGGSAADAQHIAAELVGRYKRERPGLPGIAFTTDTSVLSAVGNDYGFDYIFKRQIEALGNKGDLLIAISTSGNSENVVQAIKSGRELECQTLGLTGRNGGRVKEMSDLCIAIPSDDTPRIQEAHILIGHILCSMIDETLL